MISKRAKKAGLSLEIDRSGNRLAKQIRNAEQEKVPLMAVIGTKEKESNEITVRSRKVGDLGSYDLETLLQSLSQAVKNNIEIQEVEGISVAPIE